VLRPSASHPASCPSEDELLALAGGQLAASRRPAIESHLGHCDDCRTILATIAPLIDAHATTAAGHGPAPSATGSPAWGPETASLLRPGEEIAGRFRVRGVLGVGGMGVVYEAEHLVLGSLVALKLIRAERHAGPEATARFLREARTAARLSGPHVCRVLDAGLLDDGRTFVAMERLEGSDLAAMLHERGPLPADEAVKLLRQACEGLAEAHALGIVHRDLKPANLFLTRPVTGEPAVKVLDFGLAKALDPALVAGSPSASSLTGDNQILGSPAYMAPEQIRSPRGVDGRADIWSLGAVLHELLAGEPPFTAETIGALWAKILADPPADLRARRPDLPPALVAVVDRCLAKRPDQRFSSPTALAEALALALSPAPPSPAAGPPALPEPASVSSASSSAALVASIPPPAALPASISPPSPPAPRKAARMAGAAGVALLGLIALVLSRSSGVVSPPDRAAPPAFAAAAGSTPSPGATTRQEPSAAASASVAPGPGTAPVRPGNQADPTTPPPRPTGTAPRRPPPPSTAATASRD
jgi:serine/threonine-protein kinase